jgi:DNA-binding transcriptional MerR regulator
MKKKYYYTIGEVCNLLELKPYVLRYWETEFPQLKPRKTSGGNRKYTQKDIDLLSEIRDMLHLQKYTIEGARKKLQRKKKSPQQEINFCETKVEKKDFIIKSLKEIKNLLNN